MNKKILFAFVVLAALFVSAFKPVEVLPKKGGSVFYIKRMDAIASLAQKVHVVLNGVEVTVLVKPNTYKAVHLKPGVYNIELKIFNPEGIERKTISWTDTLKSGETYFARLSYNFGWKSRKKALKPSQFKAGPKRFYAGEVDAAGLVNPE